MLRHDEMANPGMVVDRDGVSIFPAILLPRTKLAKVSKKRKENNGNSMAQDFQSGLVRYSSIAFSQASSWSTVSQR
jgi:hypothetical protein